MELIQILTFKDSKQMPLLGDLYKILENENFINNNYDTSFISKEFNF